MQMENFVKNQANRSKGVTGEVLLQPEVRRGQRELNSLDCVHADFVAPEDGLYRVGADSQLTAGYHQYKAVAHVYTSQTACTECADGSLTWGVDAFATVREAVESGAARVLVERFESEANTYMQRALDGDDDGARVGAMLLLARIALEGGHTDQAAAALDEADELVRVNGWPPLEMYAFRAAADLLAGVTDGPWTRRALDYNPQFGEIYAVPAHFCVITRRYREAIDL